MFAYKYDNMNQLVRAPLVSIARGQNQFLMYCVGVRLCVINPQHSVDVM